MGLSVTDSARDPIKLIAAALAAQLIGGLVTQMSPLIIGGVIPGLSLTEQQAGFVAFAEFFVLSGTAIIAAPLLPRLSYRTVCLVAVLLAVAAQLGSLFTTSLQAVVALRCVAGIGEGLVYAVSLAVVASRSANPDRLYGLFQIAWAVGSMGFFSVGGQLTEAFAHRGIYGMITVVTVVLIPLLLLLPADHSDVRVQESGEAESSSAVMGIIVLLGTFLYLTVSAAVYTFSEPLGQRAGLDTGQVGFALTAGSVVGFTGALMATWLNVRRGRAMPITVFCVVFSLLAIVICINQNPVVYVGALILTVVFFYFSVPYLFGLAAALDRQGRWAAAAGSAYLLGFAVGPAFAGTVIETFGYPALGYASALVTMTAWGLLMVVVNHVQSQQRAPAPASAA